MPTWPSAGRGSSLGYVLLPITVPARMVTGTVRVLLGETTE